MAVEIISYKIKKEDEGPCVVLRVKDPDVDQRNGYIVKVKGTTKSGSQTVTGRIDMKKGGLYFFRSEREDEFVTMISFPELLEIEDVTVSPY